MANQISRSTAKDCALRRLLPLMLPLLILTGCARQEPVNETLPILNQLREQQMAEQPQLQTAVPATRRRNCQRIRSSCCISFWDARIRHGLR